MSTFRLWAVTARHWCACVIITMRSISKATLTRRAWTLMADTSGSNRDYFDCYSGHIPFIPLCSAPFYPCMFYSDRPSSFLLSVVFSFLMWCFLIRSILFFSYCSDSCFCFTVGFFSHVIFSMTYFFTAGCQRTLLSSVTIQQESSSFKPAARRSLCCLHGLSLSFQFFYKSIPNKLFETQDC